jgi:hypothetical protein
MEKDERVRRNQVKKLRRDPLLSFHGGAAPLLQEQHNGGGVVSAYDSNSSGIHNVMRITVTDEEFAAGMVVGGGAEDFGRRGVVNRGPQ